MNLEKINELIKNGIEENTNLEYKDPNSLDNNKEISKDISAMANSNGGMIIYGLCEENKDHKPTKIKWLIDHQKKEKIEQVLQSSVTPKIDLEMNSIKNPDNDKEFILVVKIPKSDSAPHQDHFDKDKRMYWRRNGYTTRQMEHYEIEDLFFKRKRPKLKLTLKPLFDPERTIIELGILNEGKVIAEKNAIILRVPQEFDINGKCWEKTIDNSIYKQFEFFDGEIPFYPNLKGTIGILQTSKKKTRIEKLRITFTIVCKEMELKEGEILIDMDLNNIVGRYNITERLYKKEDLKNSPKVIWDKWQ